MLELATLRYANVFEVAEQLQIRSNIFTHATIWLITVNKLYVKYLILYIILFYFSLFFRFPVLQNGLNVPNKMLTKIYHTKTLKEIVTKVNWKIRFHQDVTILSYFLMHLKAVDC